MKRKIDDLGFTLIELVVVIGIVAFLSSVLVLYSRSGENQIVLFREETRVVGILSRAKSLSLETFGQGGVPCGYGVHFDSPRTFLIFKDSAGDCSSATHKYSGDGKLLESYELDGRVYFKTLSFTDVVFVPPAPTVILTPSQDEGRVNIVTNDNSGSTTIKVTSSGQISTQ